MASPYRVRSCGREVAQQVGGQQLHVGEVGAGHLGHVGVLRVGDEHGELGRLQPCPAGLTFGDLLVRRQELEGPVEPPLGLQQVDVAGVHVDHRERLAPGDHQGERLGLVVGEHEVGHLVGHRRQHVVALLGRQLAGVDDAVEEDLDVDLVVAAVDARRVVDGVGVDEAAGEGELDAAELGQPEVAPLTDHAAPQLVAVDPHAVVGPVADVGVGLRLRLDVSADAAVPEQIDRRPQDDRHELVRGHRVIGGAERQARLRAELDRLHRAVEARRRRPRSRAGS